MVCNECIKEGLARGIKEIKCAVCSKMAYTNVSFNAPICMTCSNDKGICQRCGKLAGEKKDD